MKKQIASLTAAFTLAALGIAAPAQVQAQTVPVHAPAPASIYAAPAADICVSQRDINDVARALGVSIVYPGAGKGFTSGILHRTGRHIGLEYDLNNNGTATVVRAYNLDNPAARGQFNAAMQNASRLDAAGRHRLHDYNRRVQPSYRPAAVDVIAAIGLVYIAHEAISHRHDRRHDTARPHPPRRR